jgi:hypothetical protein
MMKNKLKSALILLGVVAMLWGLKPLAYLSLGTKAGGVLERVDDKEVNTEMRRGGKGVTRPTGWFVVKTPVAYRFDVMPTVAERLQRASDAPLRVGVQGEDVLYGRTQRPDFTAHAVGDEQPVIYFRAYPELNAAYQPNAMVALGGMRLLVGLVLFAAAWFVTLGNSRKPSKPLPPPPASAGTTP